MRDEERPPRCGRSPDRATSAATAPSAPTSLPPRCDGNSAEKASKDRRGARRRSRAVRPRARSEPRRMRFVSFLAQARRSRARHPWRRLHLMLRVRLLRKTLSKSCRIDRPRSPALRRASCFAATSVNARTPTPPYGRSDGTSGTSMMTCPNVPCDCAFTDGNRSKTRRQNSYRLTQTNCR